MLPKAKATEVRNWLTKAKRDLTIAGMNIANDPAITDDALFHCQQAVEKSLKALLVLHDRPFKKTHIIGELAQEVLKIVPGIDSLLKQATELTPYATVFRYPGELELPSIEDAKEGLELAEQVFTAVLAHIPTEAQPSS
jgi:HEPN domain-containing protein